MITIIYQKQTTLLALYRNNGDISQLDPKEFDNYYGKGQWVAIKQSDEPKSLKGYTIIDGKLVKTK